MASSTATDYLGRYHHCLKKYGITCPSQLDSILGRALESADNEPPSVQFQQPIQQEPCQVSVEPVMTINFKSDSIPSLQRSLSSLIGRLNIAEKGARGFRGIRKDLEVATGLKNWHEDEWEECREPIKVHTERVLIELAALGVDTNDVKVLWK
jgi:hypothetical protein